MIASATISRYVRGLIAASHSVYTSAHANPATRKLHLYLFLSEMGSINAEDAEALMQAQTHLWNHLFSFVNSMSLKCAVQLRIPHIIHNHNRPISLPDLAAAIPIPPAKTDHLRRLMRLLVHSRIFSLVAPTAGENHAEHLYALTPSSHLLVGDKGEGFSPLVLMALDSSLMNPWQFFADWLKTDGGSTPFKICHGKDMWELADSSPEFNGKFNAAMASDSHLAMNAVIVKSAAVFEGLSSLMDVGGGTGAAAREIADAFPGLKVTVLDLPHVVAGLPSTPAVDFIAGDMFERIPPADAVFIKWVLHNWSDEECVKILQKCKEAIPSRAEGGKVIILDMVVNKHNGDQKFTETQFFFDLAMCVAFTAKEREEEEWKKIFVDAGFSEYKITPIAGLHSLIEVFP